MPTRVVGEGLVSGKEAQATGKKVGKYEFFITSIHFHTFNKISIAKTNRRNRPTDRPATGRTVSVCDYSSFGPASLPHAAYSLLQINQKATEKENVNPETENPPRANGHLHSYLGTAFSVECVFVCIVYVSKVVRSVSNYFHENSHVLSTDRTWFYLRIKDELGKRLRLRVSTIQ